MLYQKGKCVSVWSVTLLRRRGGSAGSAREAVRAARAVQVIRLSLTHEATGSRGESCGGNKTAAKLHKAV